jgi:hypothetical protein
MDREERLRQQAIDKSIAGESKMKEREEISLNGSYLDLVTTMAEGNPGAVTVLAQLLKQPNGELLIFGLDDMNIRGTQIWIGYKDYCGCILNNFVNCITKRDHRMVEKINEVGLKGNHIHKAVSSGGSYHREFLKGAKGDLGFDSASKPKPKRMIRLED